MVGKKNDSGRKKMFDRAWEGGHKWFTDSGRRPKETTTMTTQTFHQLGGRNSASRRELAYALAAALEVLVGNTARWTVVVRARDGFVGVESSDDSPSDVATRVRLIALGITAAARVQVAAATDASVRDRARAARAARTGAPLGPDASSVDSLSPEVQS